MKRLLLSFAALCLVTGTLFAQQQKRDVYQATSQDDVKSAEAHADVVVQPPVTPAKPAPAFYSPNALSKIAFTSSANIYTAIVGSTNCLTADQDLGAILYTSRAGGSYGASGNDLRFSYTTDAGVSWDDILLTSATQMHRYPSGAIVNPASNTDMTAAYAGFAGPSHLGTGWTHWFTGSLKFDSTNIIANYDLIDGGSFDQHFVRYGIEACSDQTIHIAGIDSVGTEFKAITMNNGTLNTVTNQISWNQVSIPHSLFNAPLSGEDEFSTVNTAWAPDGSVGYAYLIGVDSLDPKMATQPIVFKSTDKGASWTQVPLFDFGTDTVINNRLMDWWSGVLGYAGTPRVNFSTWLCGHDATVDVNGDLHIFTTVQCGFGTTNDPDSLGFIYTFEPQILYDVHTTPTGWAARVVDTILSDYVASDESGFGVGSDAMGWNHRVQASRSADGSKIFCVWTDTDTSFVADDNNMFPDIIAWGYDVVTDKYTGAVNFTKGSAYDGDNYFHYVSNVTLKNGSEYQIPITTIQTGGDPLSPVTHYYLSGVGFNESGFVVNPGIAEEGRDELPANLYPNPANDMVNVSIELTNNTDVEISIINMMGQTVLSKTFTDMSTGQHTIPLELNSLESGIYMVTVRDNERSRTIRLIRK